MDIRVRNMFFLSYVYNNLLALKSNFPNYPQRTKLENFIKIIKAQILLNKIGDPGTFYYVQGILELPDLNIFANGDKLLLQSTMKSANNLATTYTSSVSSCISSECCGSSYNFITVINDTLKEYLTSFLSKGSSSFIKCTSSYGDTPYTLTETGEQTIYDGYCIITPTKISSTVLKIYLNNIVTYQPKAWGVDWIAGNNITTIATNDTNPSQSKIVYANVTFTYNSNTQNNWLNGTTGWPSVSEVVTTPLSTIGFFLNGAALYNALGASDSTISTSTVISGTNFTIHANAIQVEVFASCCGHSSGVLFDLPYHYHQIPRCLKSLNSVSSLSYPNEDSTPTEINAYYSNLLAYKTHPNCVGFMNDGCPIYIAVGYEYKYTPTGEYDGVETDSNGNYITCFKRSPLILSDIDLNGFSLFAVPGSVQRWWPAYKYYLDTTKKLDGKYTDVCHGCYGYTPDNGCCYHYYLMLDIDTDTDTFKTKFDILYPYDFYTIIYDNDRSDIIDRLITAMNSYGITYNGSTTDHTTSTFILMLAYFYQTKKWSEIGLTIDGYNVNQSAGPNPDGYYTGVKATYYSYEDYIASLPSTGIINILYNDLASNIGFTKFFSSSEQALFQIASQSAVSSNLYTRGTNAMTVTMNTTTNNIKTWVTNVNSSLQTNLDLKNATYESLKPIN
jgi:hypothetical protein